MNILLHSGASPNVLRPSGELYHCNEFPGVQHLLDTHRQTHSRLVFEAVTDRKGLSERLKSTFLVCFVIFVCYLPPPGSLKYGDGSQPSRVSWQMKKGRDPLSDSLGWHQNSERPSYHTNILHKSPLMIYQRPANLATNVCSDEQTHAHTHLCNGHLPDEPGLAGR